MFFFYKEVLLTVNGTYYINSNTIVVCFLSVTIRVVV